jgi:hypothetical protein
MKALLRSVAHAVVSESEGLNVARPRGNQEEQEWGMFIEVQYIIFFQLGLQQRRSHGSPNSGAMRQLVFGLM